jgi:hypothetical protein
MAKPTVKCPMSLQMVWNMQLVLREFFDVVIQHSHSAQSKAHFAKHFKFPKNPLSLPKGNRHSLNVNAKTKTSQMRNLMIMVLGFYGVRRLAEVVALTERHLFQWTNKTGQKIIVFSMTESKTHKSGDAHLWCAPSFKGAFSTMSPTALLRDFIFTMKTFGAYWFDSFSWSQDALIFRTFAGCNQNALDGGKMGDLTTIVNNGLSNMFSLKEVTVYKWKNGKKHPYLEFPKVCSIDTKEKNITVNVRKGGACFFANEAFRSLGTQLGFWRTQPAANLCNGLYAVPDVLERLEQVVLVTNQACCGQLASMAMYHLELEWKKVKLPKHPDLLRISQRVRDTLDLIMKKHFLLTFDQVLSAMPRVASFLSRILLKPEKEFHPLYVELNQWLINLSAASK